MQNPLIQRIIDDAEKTRDFSSVLDLSSHLGPFIEMYPLVPDFDRILSWLYANLNLQKISNPPIRAATLLAASLACLASLKVHSGRRAVYADITRDLEKNWSNIWRCMSFIHTHMVENTKLEPSIRLLASYPNMTILVLFSSDANLLRIASGTPGLVAMLMRISDLEVTANSQASDASPHAVHGLNTYLRLMGQQPSPRWNEEVLAPMGGSVDRVARLALKQFSFHVSQSSTNAVHLDHITSKIIHITHLSHHSAICNAFVAQRSIRLLVDVMGTLSNLPLNTESLESMTQCISKACHCLRWHIFATDGITGIIEAFQAKILPTLLRCAHMLTADDDAYFSLLCKDLPKYIIYPSVLRAAKKSLKNFNRDTLVWAKSQTTRLKRVWEAYSRFEQSMDEINAVKEGGIGIGDEVCGNKMCQKVAPRRTLYLCKNCRDVYYCSTACQREDWKGEHRSHCRAVDILRKEGSFDPIPSKDLSFVGSMVQTELLLRCHQIICACQKHNIGAPVVKFSYAEYPFKITLGSTVSLFPPGYEDDDTHKDWEAVLKDGESTPGASIIMIVYPTGQKTRLQTSKIVLPNVKMTVDHSVLDNYYAMQLMKDDGSFCPM